MSKFEGTNRPAIGAKRHSTSGTANGRPRVASASVVTDAELDPSDSASNAPSRRNGASTAQQYSSMGSRTVDRLTDKAQVTTRHTVQIRTRSPKKVPVSGKWETDNTKRREHPKSGSERPNSGGGSDSRQDISSAWLPQATLIPQFVSPLSSRVSQPPLASASDIPRALEAEPLHQLSLYAQEHAILEDLLFAFMGYEGQYIRFDKRYKPSEQEDRVLGPGFRIASGLDPSLRDLTKSMLKMATHYVAVETFVEVLAKGEFGMINHALCASIRRILREYLVLIAQMENQLLTNDDFTLHVLHLHVLPTMHIFAQLYTLSQEMLRRNNIIEEESDSEDTMDVDDLIEQLKEGGGDFGVPGSKKLLKGGNVLRLLTDRLSHMAGDPQARALLESLLRDASKPYMVMLNEWLHRGSIRDPHGEFMIRELKSINRDTLDRDYTDEYWEKRYTIRENDVPPQLEAVRERVLLAGKYLNVVRECGGIDVSTEMTDVPTIFEDSRFLQNVTDAYSHANSSLLKLLLTTHELSARLRSMKHYFFLDRSDFFSYFLYLSNSELKKPMREVNIGKLQSLLDLVLRQPGSVASADPFKEDVKIHMNPQNLTTFLMNVVNVKGFEDGEESLFKKTPNAKDEAEDHKMLGHNSLEFNYAVPFPLSLVISSKTVIRYQVMFRYLLTMRHLEGLLISCWEEHNKGVSWTNKSTDPRLEHWKRRAWTLRARMLNFVQQFIYYCTAEVIEPNWQSLMAKVSGIDAASRTVDELMDSHVDFLDTCLKECMLMNPKLLKLHDKLVNCCTYFAQYTASTSRSLCAADNSLVNSKAASIYLHTLYPSARHPIPERLKTFDPDGVTKIVESLEKYEENFNRHIRILLDALNYYAATETVALSRLCAQLSMASEKGGEDRIRDM